MERVRDGAPVFVFLTLPYLIAAFPQVAVSLRDAERGLKDIESVQFREIRPETK